MTLNWTIICASYFTQVITSNSYNNILKYFLMSLFFRVVLCSKQNREGTEISYILPAHLTLCVVHSMGLGKCIKTYTHHYSIKQGNFTALKILCALPIHPSLPWTPGNQWPFYCLHSFAFSRMSQSWNHSM